MGKINFGVMTQYKGNLEDNFKKAADLGMDSFILNACVTDDLKKEMLERAAEIKAMSANYGVKISAIWAGWGAPCYWNFYEGQNTIGLIPMAFRDRRIHYMVNAAEVACELDVQDVITHAGFIPENPYDPLYTSFVNMMYYFIDNQFKPKGVYFDFETGQETAVTLRRTIEDIGLPNVGVNLDTANLILWGKGNPVDGLKVLGKYVRCTHLKDGFWPEDSKFHGKESPIGQGEVNFPEVIRLLNENKYKGHFTIEREISGDQQKVDILAAAKMIRGLADQYDWDFKE